jgi:hypothetical protein
MRRFLNWVERLLQTVKEFWTWLWEIFKGLDIRERLMITTNFTMAIATVAIAACTLFYVIVSALLWCETKRNVSLTEKAFTVSQRPWIVFQKITERPRITAGEPIIMSARIENVGNSVAKNTLMYSTFVDDVPRRSPFTIPISASPPASLGLIAPKSPKYATIEAVATPPLSQLQIDSWNEPACPTTFRIVIYFEYFSEWSDIDGPHGTFQCLEYDAASPKLFDDCGSDGW